MFQIDESNESTLPYGCCDSFGSSLSHRIHVGNIEYLHTFPSECGHFSPNVGKYTIHGSYGFDITKISSSNSFEMNQVNRNGKIFPFPGAEQSLLSKCTYHQPNPFQKPSQHPPVCVFSFIMHNILSSAVCFPVFFLGGCGCPAKIVKIPTPPKKK